MSFSEPNVYLIAYDIADVRRLTRVHRFLKQRSLAVQYSVFLGRFNQRGLHDVMGGLALEINAGEDDVRLYPLPNRCETLMLGRDSFPRGIYLPDTQLIKFLKPRPSARSEAVVPQEGEPE
jgi:CRISPR-associated protein Cas2